MCSTKVDFGAKSYCKCLIDEALWSLPLVWVKLSLLSPLALHRPPRPWQEALDISTLWVNKSFPDKTEQSSSCVQCCCPLILLHPSEPTPEPPTLCPSRYYNLYNYKTNRAIYIYTWFTLNNAAWRKIMTVPLCCIMTSIFCNVY